MKYLRTLAMAVIAFVSVCSLDSCYREDAEDPIVYPVSADGDGEMVQAMGHLRQQPAMGAY